MKQKSIVVRLGVLVMAAIMLAVSWNATVYRHKHQLANGLKIFHSHQFPTSAGSNSPNHSHTSGQYQFLDQVNHLPGFTPILALDITVAEQEVATVSTPLVANVAPTYFLGLSQLRAPPAFGL